MRADAHTGKAARHQCVFSYWLSKGAIKTAVAGLGVSVHIIFFH